MNRKTKIKAGLGLLTLVVMVGSKLVSTEGRIRESLAKENNKVAKVQIQMAKVFNRTETLPIYEAKLNGTLNSVQEKDNSDYFNAVLNQEKHNDVKALNYYAKLSQQGDTKATEELQKREIQISKADLLE